MTTTLVAIDQKPTLVTADPAVLTSPALPGGSAPLALDATPTQVANPGRAVLRTAVAYIVGLILALPTINAALVALADALAESGVTLPAWVYAIVNGTIAAVGVVSLVITRILATPGVNAWIIRHVPALAAIPVIKVTLQ